MARAIPAVAGVALLCGAALAPLSAAGADAAAPRPGHAPVVRGEAPAQLRGAGPDEMRQLLRGHSFTAVYEGDRLLEINVLPPSDASATATAGTGDQAPFTPRPLVLDHMTALDMIRVLTEDEDEVARTRATAGLRHIGGPEATAALTKALGDDVGMVRVHAVHALADVDRTGAAVKLVRVLADDPDPQVRSAAAQVLERLRGSAARRALETTAVSDPDRSVRREARQALARWDDRSRSVQDASEDRPSGQH